MNDENPPVNPLLYMISVCLVLFSKIKKEKGTTLAQLELSFKCYILGWRGFSVGESLDKDNKDNHFSGGTLE